jgi:hypothetical protein
VFLRENSGNFLRRMGRKMDREGIGWRRGRRRGARVQRKGIGWQEGRGRWRGGGGTGDNLAEIRRNICCERLRWSSPI